MVLSALAEGLDASAAERVFGYRQATITSLSDARSPCMRRSCMNASSYSCGSHTCSWMNCAPGYAAVDRCVFLWLAIDPCTKILPVLHLGLRTQNAAHTVIHSLRQRLAPGCLPLFTSDGLHLSFSALTAHFGHWLLVGRRGRKVLRWQVAAGLIYGQVKKC